MVMELRTVWNTKTGLNYRYYECLALSKEKIKDSYDFHLHFELHWKHKYTELLDICTHKVTKLNAKTSEFLGMSIFVEKITDFLTKLEGLNLIHT